MPPERCAHCNFKWEVSGGGLCPACRSIDRLAALIRGPSVPPTCEALVVGRVRSWIADIQDLSEISRGVVPTPSGAGQREGADLAPNTGGPSPSGALLTTSPKVPPPAPPLPPLPLPASSPSAPATEVKTEERATSSAKHPRIPSRSRKKTKSKRRSRSGRSRRRARLASPVRPAGVKAEGSTSRERESRRERKARPISPRSPSRPPLHREEEHHRAPSRRPEGAHWEGPILARRPQPPPGQGVHFGKNKGVKKEERKAEFRRRQRAGQGRR